MLLSFCLVSESGNHPMTPLIHLVTPYGAPCHQIGNYYHTKSPLLVK